MEDLRWALADLRRDPSRRRHRAPLRRMRAPVVLLIITSATAELGEFPVKGEVNGRKLITTEIWRSSADPARGKGRKVGTWKHYNIRILETFVCVGIETKFEK
jgi:hypothetical protein